MTKTRFASLTALVLTILSACNSIALSQWNSAARPREELDLIYVAGTVVEIHREPAKCMLRIDQVLSGKAPNALKAIPIESLLEMSLTPAKIGLGSGTSAYPKAPDDENVLLGSQLVVSFQSKSITPYRHFPIRIVDRFHAVNELKELRMKARLANATPDSQAALTSELLAELHSTAKSPFWDEHREGAVWHPRLEETCEAILDVETETGKKIFEPLFNSLMEDIHLRAALVTFYAKRHPELDLSRTMNAMIIDLQSNPRTAQDACALLALMDRIYGVKFDESRPMQHAGEAVLEALNPSLATDEFRLAFAKRLWNGGWHEPHHERRINAMLAMLETESCDPSTKFIYPPSNTVGDWLVYELVQGQQVRPGKRESKTGVDLTKLHLTVRQQLGIATLDPNKN